MMYNTEEIANYKELTKNNILDVISEEEIMRHYLGFEFDMGKTYHSPLRKDNNPSFAVYYNRYNQLKFKDFNGLQGSCFDLVMHIYSLNFVECLTRINKDFQLGLGNSSSLPVAPAGKKIIRYPEFKANMVKKNNLIQFKPQQWTSGDVKYWDQFGINLDLLEYYNVYSAKYIFLNKKLLLKYSTYNPIYCYKFENNRVKVYRPLANKTKFKWMSNINANIIQGWDQLSETDNSLIITKSMKDVMCLKSLGFTAIAPQSETTHISDEIIDELKFRFKNIYILFDKDEAGIAGSKALCQRINNCKIVFLDTEYKDVSDNFYIYGHEKTKNLVKKIIKQ